MDNSSGAEHVFFNCIPSKLCMCLHQCEYFENGLVFFYNLYDLFLILYYLFCKITNTFNVVKMY